VLASYLFQILEMRLAKLWPAVLDTCLAQVLGTLAMNIESVLLEEQRGSLLVLRMNRPDRLNAINGDLMESLRDSLQRAKDDDEIRAVVITGSGRSFCSGGDVREGARPRRKAVPDNQPRNKRQELVDAQIECTQAAFLLHSMPKPSIALVRGAAMGAGMSLALACDFRVISNTTVFRTAFVNNALSGDYGMAYFLTRALGVPKALELMMLSPKLDAEAIDQLGLATRVVADGQLEEEGFALAKKLTDGPTIAYAGVKSNIVAAQSGDIQEYLRTECENQVACSFSEDIREAGRAFLEKRKPQFCGR